MELHWRHAYLSEHGLFASQFHRLEQTWSNCRLGPCSRALVGLTRNWTPVSRVEFKRAGDRDSTTALLLLLLLSFTDSDRPVPLVNNVQVAVINTVNITYMYMMPLWCLHAVPPGFCDLLAECTVMTEFSNKNMWNDLRAFPRDYDTQAYGQHQVL